jgi:hypothetical protein
MDIDYDDTDGIDCPDEYEPEEPDDNSDIFDDSHEDMSEEDAIGVFDLAVALGLGEEIGLSEAETIKATIEQERQAKRESMAVADDLVELDSKSNKKKGEPRSLKTRKSDDKHFSSVTGKLKCPFEQWIKDVAAGRKTVHDPVGGINSYGKDEY